MIPFNTNLEMTDIYFCLVFGEQMILKFATFILRLIQIAQFLHLDYLQKFTKGFGTPGTLANICIGDSGRPRSVTIPEVEERLSNEIATHPETSVRSIEACLV